jgi:hypothetical protein
MLDPSGYVIDDALACGPLRALGWEVEAVPWNRPGVSWREYEVVVVRSPWDYHHHPEAFLSVLAEVERPGTRLENRLPLLRWNLHKTYLRDLAAHGVPTIPTVWRDRLRPGDLEGLFDEVPGDEVVIKPIVSASARGAFRLDRRSLRRKGREVEAFFSDRAFMAQPLARAVLDEGEYSLVYFNGEHSHTVLKTPNPGDFRVQEEHGAAVCTAVADAVLQRAGREALDALSEVPLYARADFVRSNEDRTYWLMELELVEPSLYLRMDPAAAGRFANALDARMTAGRAHGPSPTSTGR